MSYIIGSTYKTTTGTIKEFFQFLAQQNILQLALAFIIGLQVNAIANGFIDSFISPIINRLLGTGKNNLEDYTVTVFGAQFKIGSFIVLLMKFMIFLFILFMVVVYLPKKVFGVNLITQSVTQSSPAPVAQPSQPVH